MTCFRSFRAAGVLLAALASLSLTACTVNPATGQRQLTLITEAQEIQMGRESHQAVLAQMGRVPDEELQTYIQELGASLAAQSERPNLPWTFTVVDDPIVNAFALPGGFIYMTRGILTHFNSEAELVSVLGHEIGHVTGRHGVERLSKAQLATIGVGVATIASEDFRQYGQLAQMGLGVLFLKFSRDDERQADDLGLRYLARGGFEPDEMPKVFLTLDRVSQAAGAGGTPGWLATHPNPVNRASRISEQIVSLPPEAQDGVVNRDSYLRRLDDMMFGTNPREGFFKENVFYHPDMAFKLTFPQGWRGVNQRQAVGAISPEQDAAVVLTLAGEDTPQAAVNAFFSQDNLERGQAWRRGFFNFRTVPPEATGGQTPTRMRGIVGFFRHQNQVFRLMGYTADERWSGRGRDLQSALGTFERLTDRRYLNVQPKRVDLVTLPSAMTLREFASRYPSTIELGELAIMNGVGEDQRLERGTLVKRVVGGEIP